MQRERKLKLFEQFEVNKEDFLPELVTFTWTLRVSNAI
jgi:hypothetical protein